MGRLCLLMQLPDSKFQYIQQAPIDICMPVPPHLEKCGVQKKLFRSLRSRILFCTPTLKSVAPPPDSVYRRGGEVDNRRCQNCYGCYQKSDVF